MESEEKKENEVRIEKSKNKSKNGTCEERLESFSKYFYKLANKKIEEFEKESAVNGEAKIGKVPQILLSAVKPVGHAASAGVAYATGPAAVGAVKTVNKATDEAINTVGKFWYAKHHRTKAKKVTKYIQLQSKTDLRDALLDAAGELFCAFEEQFCNVFDADGSWIRAMEKLANDAVNRFINFINKADESELSTDILCNSQFIVKSILSGESKEGLATTICNFFKINKVRNIKMVPTSIKKQIPKPGHSLMGCQENWNTSDMYEGIGIIEKKDDTDYYYINKVSDKSTIYGYRLKFAWENIDSFIQNAKPTHEYQYMLDEYKVQKIKCKVINDLNNDDPKHLLQNMHEKIDQTDFKIKEPIKTSSDVTDNSCNQTLSTNKIRYFNNIYEPKLSSVMADNNSKPYIYDVDLPTHLNICREKFLNILQEKIKGNGTHMISQMVAITGMVGVGKTELVKHYIQRNKDIYENIIWIDGTSYDTIVNSLRNIFIENVNIPDIDLIKEVYKLFSNRKTLFVFDNLQSYKLEVTGVKELSILPLNVNFVDKIFIIITSQSRNWAELETINIDLFISNESQTYINSALKIEDDTQDDHIKQLSNIMQNLPLALLQATNFICEKNKQQSVLNVNYTIQDYLLEYNSSKEVLLNYPFYEHSIYSYKNTVFNALSNAIKYIEHQKYGILSIHILKIISFINSNSIPICLFTKNVTSGMHDFSNAINLLEKNCLIEKNEAGTFDVHVLIQEVMKIMIERDNETSHYFYQLYNLFMRFFSSEDIENLTEAKLITPHLEILQQQVENSKINSEFKRKFIYKILLWRSIRLLNLNKYEDNDTLLKLIEEINSLPKYDQEEDLFILDNLHEAYSKSNKNKNKYKILERCFDLKVRLYGETSPILVKTLKEMYLAVDINNIKEECEQIIKIIKQIYNCTYKNDSLKMLPLFEDIFEDIENNTQHTDNMCDTEIIEKKHFISKEILQIYIQNYHK